MELLNPINALCPLDGRYRKDVRELSDFFSEKALIKYRVIVEGEYLIALSELDGAGPREFTDNEKELIRGLYDVSDEDAMLIKRIEKEDHGILEINDGKKTEHDVKAVEYYYKYVLKDSSLSDSLEWIHFCLTSEDPNNIAYGMMLADGIGNILLPNAQNLYDKLEELAETHKNVPMLARTHGQPASPTTVGKEFKNFAERIKENMDDIANHKIKVKLNGATGNYNAQYAAYPDVNWLKFTKDFISRLSEGKKMNLVPNYYTTQVEPHDTYAKLFDKVKHLNTAVINFNGDMWRYISDDWFNQKPKGKEVGSSTMPHKINPIDFENSWGNLDMGRMFCEFFARDLPDELLQRYLKDSTIERNFGMALGYSLLGYKNALRGLNKILVNEQRIVEGLEAHPEVVSEAIQVILRREGVEKPYELLKEFTRGKKVTLEDLRQFIDTLEVSGEVKDELKAITPQNYLGIAPLLASKDFSPEAEAAK